jgi:DNA invertase Pin-like site-specific DNA recombinase
MFGGIPENSRYWYVRVSSKLQETNSLIESQKNELIQKCVSEFNIQIEVESATASIQNRPIFHKLVKTEFKKLKKKIY